MQLGDGARRALDEASSVQTGIELSVIQAPTIAVVGPVIAPAVSNACGTRQARALARWHRHSAATN